jgi:ribosomal protein L13
MYYKDIRPNSRNYCLIVMGLNTALRISDLLRLKWDNVYNFEHHEFRTHFLINEQKTGKKLEKKFHRTHSGWIGGLKETQYKTLMAENSDKAMTYAVKGMIPSNTIGAKAMTRLHCYKAADHAHAAQKPEAVEI